MGGPECQGAQPIPSASVGNRKVEVELKLYSNSTIPNVHYLWLRFFDANTNQTIRHVSFFLNITKNNVSLLHDMFHTHTGILTIQVNSINTQFNGTILGIQEPYLNAWTPRDNSSTVVAYAPIFNDANSTYSLKLTMYAIDSDNNIFSDERIAPKFNFDLSLNQQNQIVSSQNMEIPEFPFAIPILFVGITALILLFKIEFKTNI